MQRQKLRILSIILAAVLVVSAVLVVCLVVFTGKDDLPPAIETPGGDVGDTGGGGNMGGGDTGDGDTGGGDTAPEPAPDPEPSDPYVKFNFDADDGTELSYSGTAQVSATYSKNTAQETIAQIGKAFVVTPNGDESVSVRFRSFDASEGFSVSFWYKSGGSASDCSDWSHIARMRTASLRFINLNFNDTLNSGGNLYPPDQGGVLQNGASTDSLANSPSWSYISAVVLESGVYFYQNGILLCTYSAGQSGTNGEQVQSVSDNFLEGVAAGEELRLFGNNEGSAEFYVDELTLRGGMTAEEVLKLYRAERDLLRAPEQPTEGDYPTDPRFDPLTGYGAENTYTTTANVHDPSIIEVEENGKAVYYTFSTDNMGPKFGYQIRRSEDLIHWRYVGVAIEGYNENGGMPSAGSVTQSNALYSVYQVIKEDTKWANLYTLWAPDVVKGADGKYWLYGCWTAAFGQGHSVIFLCKAETVTGPYTFESILVYSYDGWKHGPNAIDPQIYYAGDKMFMAYGSFDGGIYSLELDPKTGKRLSSDRYYNADWLSVKNTDGADTAAARYGTRLVYTAATEGPTVNYHEGVPIYTGDPASFDESAVTYEDRYYLMGSAGILSSTYNMRAFVGTLGEDGAVDFSSPYGTNGSRVSGSFSWRSNMNDPSVSFDFAYPGHNDTITTSDGVNLLVYHDRTTFISGNINHYLMLSMYGFNSRGDLVMSPNRYAGEKERAVDASELLGQYMFAAVTNDSYGSSFGNGYAQTGLEFASNGVLKYNGAQVGSWVQYGENWVYIDIVTAIYMGGGSLSGKYYGKAFPAYIEREGRGGISMSFVSEDGLDTLYLNEDFA